MNFKFQKLNVNENFCKYCDSKINVCDNYCSVCGKKIEKCENTFDEKSLNEFKLGDKF